VLQRDHFPDDTEDTAILAACGERGWIYVAQDFAVRKNPAELKALEDAGVHAIFLRGRQQTAEWVIRNLRAANAKIVNALRTATKPVHLEVFADGIRILNESVQEVDGG